MIYIITPSPITKALLVYTILNNGSAEYLENVFHVILVCFLLIKVLHYNDKTGIT